MRGVRFSLIVLVLASALLLTACEFSASTANIRSATLARDEAGTQPTSTFEPTETFYLIVDLANAPDDTTVKTVWYAVAVGSAAAPNTLIDQAELASGSGTLTFNLAPAGQWAPGTYKVEIYLNDELNQTLDITVNGQVVGEAPAADQPAATAEPAAATEPAATVDPAGGAQTSPSGAVATLQDVRQATVRIEAQGSFVDPEFGAIMNAAGQGTGFIIDPSGLAVTNNHVVTGAALLRVYVEGEDEPRNARVLGVSECSDLAVIDIEGEGLPYLDWRQDDIPVGLDIYVAGFPLAGNEEFTLTRGIVSKADADGETNWASVDRVLEVDATINPGNSGGPLVDADGRVVGVNYASSNQTNQYFSISRDEAVPVIDQLKTGTDVDAIGINGQAVTDGESIFGIWVASVESGSPAAEAGIEAGDILTMLEGLVLATDGTMSSYCDILRGRDPGDTMAIEVLRLSSGEILGGELNGTSLEVTGTLGAGQTPPDGSTTGAAYSGFAQVQDDSGTLLMSVPVEWTDVDGEPWLLSGEDVGVAITASSDVNAYRNTWTTPGAFFGASNSLAAEYDAAGFLDQIDLSSDCVYDGRSPYEDPLYTGFYDSYSNCGGQGTRFIVLSAQPAARNVLLMVQVQMVSDADNEALEQILNSFTYVGS